MSTAFFLGVSNGLVCLSSCGPVIIPWLVSEQNSLKISAFHVFLFLIGRFFGYILFAILAWIIGMAIAQSKMATFCVNFAEIILGGWLIYHGFQKPQNCDQHTCRIQASPVKHFLIPMIMGFVTGINLCPPFLLVLTELTQTSNLITTLIFIIFYYFGSMVWFVLLPFLGGFAKLPNIAQIARFSTSLVGLYFFYKGTIAIGSVWLN